MSGFDFKNVKNVFFLGSGASVASGLKIGPGVISDIFRIRTTPLGKQHEGPKLVKHYVRFIDNCRKLYNFTNPTKDEIDEQKKIKSFEKELKKAPIDFEDYFSRVHLWNESALFKDKIPTPNSNWIEPNLMILLYWYFWHHIREFHDKGEFPESQGRDYIKEFLKPLNPETDVIITTNNDLLFETNAYDHQESVVYRPDLVKNKQFLYLKLHGSVNWISKHSVGDTYKIEDENGLKEEKKVADEPTFLIDSNKGNHIKIIHTYFRIYENQRPEFVIMPPFLYKGLQNTGPIQLLLDNVWQWAGECMENAEKIIFAGLGLRDTDVLLQLLIKSSLAQNKAQKKAQNKKNPKIYLVDPCKDNLIPRYKKIMDLEAWYPMNFENFVDSEQFKEIFH